MKYFALLTTLGENLLAQATALGTKIELTQMGIGDGGGALPTPDTKQTKLINEKRRAAINTLFIDDKNKNQIIAEQIIPETEGGYWIREIGLYDKSGNLIAVANCPETYKPQLSEGSGRTQTIRMILVVSHTETITLKIDPAVVLATRDYVDGLIQVQDKKLSDLSTKTQVDLNKKIDKASITDQLGNDRTKVVSQGLLTEQLGKKQNSGDFATNAALKDGLDKKLDKTGGDIDGTITVKSTSLTVAGPNDFSGLNLRRIASGHVRLESNPVGSANTLTIVNRDSGGKNISVVSIPNKTGVMAFSGDYGIGGASANSFYLTSVLDFGSMQKGIFNVSPESTAGLTEIGLKGTYGNAIVAKNNNAAGVTAIIMSQTGENAISVLRKNRQQDNHELIKIYTSANVTADQSGYLRTANNTEELMGVPIGGSVLWNGVWDENDPIAEFYWPNEGRSFSAIAYPIAAKRFPSLKLPDDRGYALRVADNGRGIDVGRKVGTYQEDAIRNITGTLSQLNDRLNDFGGAFYQVEVNGSSAGLNGGGNGRKVGFDASRVVPTATENRMKNVAKILITRMK